VASGILNVNKPAGPTSFTVVRRLKRLAGISKIGHGGTLDPSAEGVLPILVNAATRLADFVHDWPKTYVATVRFGAVSDSGDREGTITRGGDVSNLDRERIATKLSSFVGWIEQVPPAYSALKQGGESVYRKARRGEAVELAARPVEIKAISLLDYDLASACGQLEVQCGRGMYVRSLARDLGEALGCGAYLAALRRTAVGPLSIAAAKPVEEIMAMGDDWTQSLLAMDLPLRHWPAITLEPSEVEAVKRGQSLPAPTHAVGRYRMLDRCGVLIAWGEVEGQRLQPRAVFEQ
jgi:tRNA pseudouridine55 synthase